MKYLISLEKKSSVLNFVKSLALIVPKFLKEIKVEEDNNSFSIILDVFPFHLENMFYFFKCNSLFQFEQLIDVTAVDYLKNDSSRFKVFYQLLSLRFNKRISICVSNFFKMGLPTVSHLYLCSGWLEREIWDLFGIFFWGHQDLRRILTDYGFKGFPLRKDFPLSGFSEVRYDDEIKLVFYEPIELTQEFRLFDSLSPWNKSSNKNF